MQQYMSHYGQMKSYDPMTARSDQLINELFDRASKTHDLVTTETSNEKEFYSVKKGSDIKDGYYVKLYNNQLISLIHYKDGLKHGASYSWYLTGQRQYEQLFMENNLHGFYTHWNIDGDIIEIIRYSNGLKDGFNIQYNDNTNEIIHLDR